MTRHHIIGYARRDMERSIGSRAPYCLSQWLDMPHQQVGPAL
jgi:predicted Zn-ribbon and HTH transcriptional regulator